MKALFSSLCLSLLLVGSLPLQAATIEQITNQIIQANDLPSDLIQTVQIEESNSINAYTNGEKVVITKKLWDLLENDDQKAFVLGHEVAHVALSHIEKGGRRRLGIVLLDRILASVLGPRSQQFSSLGLGLIDRRYSRNAEYQADELGIELMQKADYRPKASVRVFEILHEQNPDGTPEFLRTHPIKDNRIDALVRKYPAHFE